MIRYVINGFGPPLDLGRALGGREPTITRVGTCVVIGQASRVRAVPSHIAPERTLTFAQLIYAGRRAS